MDEKNCQDKACIPFFVHENTMMHYNRVNKRILERRLIDGVTFERLAEEFDMSPRQIKNILYKNEEYLFRHIKE